MLHPARWLLLATIFFFVGIQQAGIRRRLFTVLHIVTILLFFISQLRGIAPLPENVISFFFGWLVHTSGMLAVDSKITHLSSLPPLRRLQATFLLWIDFRNIHHDHGVGRACYIGPKDRIVFGLRRIMHALILLVLKHGIMCYLAKPLLHTLDLVPDDFSPMNQGLLPSFEMRGLILRLVVSTQWVCTTYLHLSAAHDLFAVLFVSILGWSSKSDWPPLYGSISSAYSLRRFWGSFWHRLHNAPFARYTPSILVHQSNQLSYGTALKNTLRSFWIFLMSAVCHGMVGLVVYRQANFSAEIRFFLSNWIICLLETILIQVLKKWKKRPDINSIRWKWALRFIRRVCGYTSVFFFFFCTVPAWRYPLVYNTWVLSR